MKKAKNIFIEGEITPDFIAISISKHQSKTGIGAHDIFLGQVRADQIDGKNVDGIEFTAETELANQITNEIREAAFSKFGLSCSHIYHSLGQIKTGEICFFVFVSAPHRQSCFDAIQFMVNEVKASAPIFGKEIFDDGTYQWKVSRS